MVALAKVNVALGESLVCLQGNQKYEVFMGQNGEDINLFDKERNFQPLYIGILHDELSTKFKSLEDKQDFPYHYFFGLGNGLLYKMMISQFKNLKRIFVFEPELEILYTVLHVVDFSREIETESIVFMWTKTFTFENALYLLRDTNVFIYAKNYELMPIVAYYNHYFKEMGRINQMLLRAFEHVIVTLGNSAEDSLVGLEHHLNNLPMMIHTPTLDELVAKGKNSSIAIIVSTGPSLSKQLDLLKSIQQYVTILCIDASFPILSRYGIVPDIVFSLERVKETAQFYEDTPSQFHQSPIFCVTSIAHQKLLDSMKSKQIQMNIRPYHYLTYFDTPEWGYMGFGMSAANMAYEFAMLAHFDKCVLIGQDLSFADDGSSHAKEHVRGVNDVAVKETVLLDAYGGDGKVKSTLVWKMFLNYFEQDISTVNEIMPTYNCTEGGVRIARTIEMPFRRFIDEYINKTITKQKIKLDEPDTSLVQKSKEAYTKKINDMVDYISDKKAQTEKVFLNLMEFLESIEQHNKEQQLDKIDFKVAESLIADIERIKELFQEREFSAIVYDFLRSYIISQELEIAKLQVKCVKNEEELKVKMIEWLYMHKFWLFSLAGGMEAILVVVKRATQKDCV